MRRTAVTPTLLTVCLTGLLACGEAAEQSAGGSSSTTATTNTTTTVTAETTTSTAGPTTTTVEQVLSEDSRLRPDGIGPVRMGMTPTEATQAVGREVAMDERSLLHDAESVCGFAAVSGGPEDLLFMVLRHSPTAEWRIHRVDVVEASRIATDGGIRIGSTEDEVKQVYGADKVKVEPHEYTGPVGHYLVVDADGEGTGFMLLFETDGTRVTQFRSGNDEPVRYVEGCA